MTSNQKRATRLAGGGAPAPDRDLTLDGAAPARRQDAAARTLAAACTTGGRRNTLSTSITNPPPAQARNTPSNEPSTSRAQPADAGPTAAAVLIRHISE